MDDTKCKALKEELAEQIPTDALREAVRVLQPDEVGDADQLAISPAIAQSQGSPVLAVWWD